MPDRTKEELQVIYDDLVEFGKLLDELHELGELWPNPLNDKTWDEEKNEYYGASIRGLKKLLDQKVNSCEVKTWCEVELREQRKNKDAYGFWNHVATVYNSSEEYEINGLSFNEFKNEILEVVQGTADQLQISRVNKYLDDIGKSACEPRAMLREANDQSEIISTYPIAMNSNLSKNGRNL